MTLRARRLFLPFLLVGLIAAGCSSSDGETTTAAALAIEEPDTSDATEQDRDNKDRDNQDGDNQDGGSLGQATSIPVPEDDEAANAAIAGLDGEQPPEVLDADPRTTAQSFVRARFNIDPEPEWISCMIAETEQDEVLEASLRTPSVAQGRVDDSQLRALTFAMNGCIDTLSLADWATQAIGPQGEVQQTAPPCLVERFEQAATGDTTFYNFVALTYQFRLDPDGVDSLVDSLASCAPIPSLSDFFAGQAEQSTNFTTMVDRDCLVDVLSPSEVSQEFWDLFVGGGVPANTVIDPFIQQCSETRTSDLAPSVPDTFVPWAGSGDLAGVQPPARNRIYTSAPPMVLDPAARYEAVLATGGGEVRIELFADSAPLTVNNFVQLARDGFYDNIVFHRVLAGFMAQAGDPTATGTGNPGYQFADEFESGAAMDRKGLLAMANTGPNTNGSQFFITFAAAEWLTGLHTIFGEVTQGIEIVDNIELRDPANPTGPGQLIESVTIIETIVE